MVLPICSRVAVPLRLALCRPSCHHHDEFILGPVCPPHILPADCDGRISPEDLCCSLSRVAICCPGGCVLRPRREVVAELLKRLQVDGARCVVRLA